MDPVGGNSNFTLELMPKYQMVYEPVEFVGLRKCTQFRMQVAGVVGGSDELVNAFMACGTYYEVVEDVSIGSNVDARNICTWSADSNPKSPAGKRYRWGGIEGKAVQPTICGRLPNTLRPFQFYILVES